MPLPSPLQTATVVGYWASPAGGGPLTGAATLVPLNAAISPAADVLLTTTPGKITLVNGIAQWTGVLLTDSAGLSNRVPYRLVVSGDDYFTDEVIELLTSMVSAGTIRLSTVAAAQPTVSVTTYLLAASLGQIGGPAGPLDSNGQIPLNQIPSGSTTPDATTISKGVVQLAGDLAGTAAAPTVPGLAGKQPLDSDLTAIAALAPADGALIQRVAGAWASQTAAQVKASLGITYGDITGTVPTAALPPLAINETFTVADQAAMLALTAQRGDMAIRTDNGRTYVLSTDSPGTLADWKEVLAAGQVQSVAGKTGVVLLVKADVGLSNVDNTSDANKPVSTAQQTALNGKVDKSLVDAAGDLYVGTADNTVARLPVGTNGQILVADSTQTPGMRWSARTNPAYDPVMEGLIAVAADPALFRSGSPLGTAGWAVRLTIPAGLPINGLVACVSSAGTVNAGGTNGYAINTDAGALVASTPDDNNLWTSNGPRPATFAAPIAAQSTDRQVFASLRQSGYSVPPNYDFVDGTGNGGRLNGLQGGKRRSLILTGSVWGAIDPVAGPTGGGYMPFIGVF